MQTASLLTQQIRRWITANRSLLLSLALLAVVMLVLGRFLELRSVERQLDEQREQTSVRLSTIRYQLESSLSQNLSFINGLAAFISSYPDFTQAQFDRYAGTIISSVPSLINLSAAPDLVLKYVFPYQGNEQAIGLNFMRSPEQRVAVEKLLATRDTVVVGPVPLVQGGSAFVARAPVYTFNADSSENFWGIVSAPILTDTIYSMAGLRDVGADLQVAIRGSDELLSQDVFFGDEETFSHPAAVLMPVAVQGSDWEIAAAPALDHNLGVGTTSLRYNMLALFLLLAVIVVLRHRQVEYNKSLRAIIFRNEGFLRAVETVSRVGGWRWCNGYFTEVSAQAREIMRLPSEASSFDIAAFCHRIDSRSSAAFENHILAAVRDLQRIDLELELRRSDGDLLWLHLKADVINGNNGTELIGAIQDITQQKKADQLIEYQANYDLLTGLPNRALFQGRLQHTLLQAARRNTRIAVLFVDLDNFKSVNDNLGHDAGDELLVESARRIAASVRSIDTVARYSGDEFVALLVDVFSVSVAARIAEDMVLAMRKPFLLGGRQVYCSVSVGVSFFPDDGAQADTLLIKSDQAMYEVKKSGRNAWQFYTAAMQHESEQKHSLYNELVAAINQGQLQVCYQPVACAQAGRIVSCEALVRWQTADGNWVAPEVFIPVAEERGLINRIDLFVLKHSIKSIRRLNARLGSRIALSVNVSPRLLHLRDEDAHDWLRVLEQERDLDLIIEVTERVLVDEQGNTKKVLERLHAAGVRIAIDDFGTGYSGLSYFSRFPVSTLKIDRSFVRDIGQRATETTLVETILLLASKLGIEVIAEGVETAEQAEFLRLHGCNFLQGYHISRPLSEQAFEALLLEQRELWISQQR